MPDEPTSSAPRSPTERLVRLELSVMRIERELSALQAAVGRLAEAGNGTTPVAAVAAPIPAPGQATVVPQPAETPPSPPALSEPLRREPAPVRSAPPGPIRARPAPGGPQRSPGAIDIEPLVGRYGTLALATLTILMGVGAFLTWAITSGKLGPEVRVAIGAVAAMGTALAGWRLRRRGTKRFGDALLSLALAMVHLEAWGAGPNLHLIPEPVALGVAALASGLLALLAIREGEQSLFVVGVGGALIAPFVTSSGGGNIDALLTYGLIVHLAGMAGIRARSWPGAALVLTLACWWYTGVAAGMLPNAGRAGPPWLPTAGPSYFALACAWGALLLVRGAFRAAIAQSALIALAGTLFVDAVQSAASGLAPILAAVATVSAYATLRDPEVRTGRTLVGAVVIPLATFGAALAWVDDTTSLSAGGIALVWTVLALGAALTSDGAMRGLHMMVAGIASAAAIFLVLEDRDLVCILALAGHAVALSLVVRRLRAKPLVVPIVMVLLAISIWSYHLLTRRTAFDYAPFLTSASLAAFGTSLAWLVFSWNASRTMFADASPWGPRLAVIVRLAGVVAAFLWGREELLRAVSEDAATFLLILYYAAVGVAAIGLGRSRELPPLRHAGLTLAIFAALKSVVQASTLVIGWRVGSYLLAGGFMLAVAYWYRKDS